MIYISLSISMHIPDAGGKGHLVLNARHLRRPHIFIYMYIYFSMDDDACLFSRLSSTCKKCRSYVYSLQKKVHNKSRRTVILHEDDDDSHPDAAHTHARTRTHCVDATFVLFGAFPLCFVSEFSWSLSGLHSRQVQLRLQRHLEIEKRHHSRLL